MAQKIYKAKLARSFTLERLAEDEETRTVRASLSSEGAEVQRWFGKEVLSHDPKAVDLTRARGGLPLLFNHNPDNLIGRASNVRLEDGRLKADLTFSRSAGASEKWEDVRSGFLDGISIGYEVKKYETSPKSDKVTVTRWMPYEVSLVTIPADHSVGVNRSMRSEDQDMDVDQNATRKKIAELFKRYLSRGAQYIELQTRALVEDDWDMERAQGELLKLVSAQAPEPTGSLERQTFIEPGTDEKDKFMEKATRAIEVRAGLERKPEIIAEARRDGLMSLSVMDLAREALALKGVKAVGSKLEIMGRALSRRDLGGHTSSDFPAILENIASKALMMGWDEAPESFPMWTRKGTLTDFKQATRTGLGEFPNPERIPEGGGYKYVTTSDRKEPIQLLTYGAMFNISRQALINDDLSAFSSTGQKLARAAKRQVGDVVYDMLDQNSALGPTLTQDATTLFHANHGNLVTSGAVPSVATLNAAYLAMMTQQDNDSNVKALNIIPRYILAGATLKATIDALIGNNYDPAATAGTLVINPYYQKLTPVYDGRIDGMTHSGNGWYLFADPNVYDTVEVAYLDGQDTPYLESKEGWSVDGLETKVRIDCGVAALGYQGAYYNDGVT